MNRSKLRHLALFVPVVVGVIYGCWIVLGNPFWIQTVCRVGDASSSLALVTYKTLNVPTPLDPGGRYWTSGAVLYEEWWGIGKRFWLEQGIYKEQLKSYGERICNLSRVKDGVAVLFPLHNQGAVWMRSEDVDHQAYDRRTEENRVAPAESIVVGQLSVPKFEMNVIAGWGPPSIQGHPRRIYRWFTRGIEIRSRTLFVHQVAPDWQHDFFSRCREPFALEPVWDRKGCYPMISRIVASADFGNTWILDSCELLPAAKEAFGNNVTLTDCENGRNLEEWIVEAK